MIIESEFSDNAEGEEIFKKHLTLKFRYDIISTLTIWQRIKYAGVAELADALASGASVRKDVQVQVLFLAPRRSKVRFAPIFFFKENHPPAPLLLLFRKKSRSHRLTACKCAVFTPIGSLPTFCGCACRRQSFLSHLFNSSVHKNTRIFSLSKCRYEHPYQSE